MGEGGRQREGTASAERLRFPPIAITIAGYLLRPAVQEDFESLLSPGGRCPGFPLRISLDGDQAGASPS